MLLALSGDTRLGASDTRLGSVRVRAPWGPDVPVTLRIDVSDDGRGMNPEVLRRKAVDGLTSLRAGSTMHAVVEPGALDLFREDRGNA